MRWIVCAQRFIVTDHLEVRWGRMSQRDRSLGVVAIKSAQGVDFASRAALKAWSTYGNPSRELLHRYATIIVVIGTRS